MASSSTNSSSPQSHLPTAAERRYVDEIHRMAHANIPDIPYNPFVEDYIRKVRAGDARFKDEVKASSGGGGITLGGGGMGGMASLLAGMGRGGGGGGMGGGRAARGGDGGGGGGAGGDGPPEELKQMILEMEQGLANAFLEAKK